MQIKRGYELLCVISGVATALCFAVDSIWFLCFISLIPFFISLMQNKDRLKRIVKLSYCYAMSYYIVTLLWFYELEPVVAQYMSGALAVFTMTLALLLASAIEASIITLFIGFFYKLKRNNLLDVLSISALYMLSEWFASILDILAFPWARLANITAAAPWYIQSASLFGSLFLSLGVLLINGLLAYAFLTFKENKALNKKAVAALLSAVVIFGANTLYGVIRMNTLTEPAEKTEILMVQGNLAAGVKWDTPIEETIETHIRLTKEYMTADTRLVVWPETAIPVTLLSDDYARGAIVDFVKQAHITLITGAFDMDEQNRSYNAMFVITPDGEISQPYYKQLLVPFGEFIPFREVIDKIAFWVTDTDILKDEQTSGSGYKIFQTPEGRLSGIICYESILPSISSQPAANGSELITMITNDSWFGDSYALKQHLSHAVLRAVENDRYVARAGNCGITALIDPKGRIVSQIPIYEQRTLRGEIAFITDKTLYTMTGDIIVIPAFAYCLYLLLEKPLARIFKKKTKKEPGV